MQVIKLILNKLSSAKVSLVADLKQNTALSLLIVVALLVVVPPGYASLTSKRAEKTEDKKVLAAKTEVSIPTPTATPTPTLIPTVSKKISNPANTPVPTSTPTPTNTQSNSGQSNSQVPTPTPTQTQSQNSNPTPTITPTPTLSPTPTQEAGLKIEVKVDYGGQKSSDSYSVTVEPGSNAWETVQEAIGSGNLAYTDYGGDLGIFITSFNGVAAAPNQYYEFRVNGASSNVGVSAYTVANNDVLEFVLTTF